MKNLLSCAIVALICVSAGAADLNKTWSLNAWSGYKPEPKMEISQDGMIHISNVTAKYGVGLISRVRVPAKAGDMLKFKAMVKGKGKIFFQLQDYDAKGKWIGVAPKSVKADLTSEWREITLSVQAENHKDKVTAASVATTGIGKGGELYIKNTTMNVEESEFAGDYRFPRHWTVFAPVPPDLKAPLTVIPQKLGNVLPRQVALDNNTIRVKSYFKEQKIRNTVWLYAQMNADAAGTYTIGAGADYFMAIWVNGQCVLDTLKSGDASDDPHFTNHKVKVNIRKGKNIFAVKFQTGSGKNPAISLGGAEDLRNLSSIVKTVQVYQRDDYEKSVARSGNPKRIQDILTDGIETKTMMGIYNKGAVITFGKKYQMPAQTAGKLFATGIRLYKFNGAGELCFRAGSGMTLSVGRSDTRSDLTMTVKQNGKALKSAVLPLNALPSDIVFAVDANEYYVNAMSLQDSKLRSISGKHTVRVVSPLETSIQVNVPSVTVDEYFVGLAKREVKSNTVPFKIDLNATFDPVKAGWKLIWADEFNGKEVDWKNTWMNSPWAPEPRNRDMAYLKDGLLHIRADFKPDPKKNGAITGRTVGLYSQKRFRYGYYEARVRFTKQPGWWAAFWMLDEGRNMSVAGGYEIDIFEDYSTRGGKKTVADNLHVNFGPGQRSYGYHFQLPGSLDEFYTIGCKWTPFEVSIYLNGKLIRSGSRHSPYQSVTYDAMNHGFCTSSLYVCLSGQCGSSGGKSKVMTSEEYLVDYVRAYEYPHQQDPQITFTKKPAKSVCNAGEKLVFEVKGTPSKISKAPIKNVYLFDNGNLIAFKSGSSARFDFAIDQKHYADTIWASAGRSNAKIVFDAYPHLFTAVVQDENGKTAATAVYPVIVDMKLSKPYKGIMPVVPGKIETNKFDEGGNGIATYKQYRGGGTFPVGKEGLFSRKALNLREGGEWANFSFKASKSGKYTINLNRAVYRRFWPLRAIVLIDGIYVGDFIAKEHQETAVMKNINLTAGNHRLTLISACAYGIWPVSMEFSL